MVPPAYALQSSRHASPQDSHEDLATSRDEVLAQDDAWLIQAPQKDPSLLRADPVSVKNVSRRSVSSFALTQWLPFLGLALTTPLTLALLIANARNYGITGNVFETVVANRASIQIAVQIVAGGLGFLNITALTHVINYAVRLNMQGSPISLDNLKVAAGLSTPAVFWRLPWIRLLIVAAFAFIAVVPSALWAGALTPITFNAIKHHTILVPSYAGNEQMTFVKEYPSEASDATPSRWTNRGLFSYVVGMKLQGLLLSTIASACTTDGSIRMHNKLDYTGYRYGGRSYGVGASAGLMDDSLASDTRTIAYSYQEAGYNSAVSCIYNSSSEFSLTQLENYLMLWAAEGPVPDSPPDDPEYSVYIGRGSNVIVAIGVTGKVARPRYVSFAAGANYSILHNVQCQLDFKPSLFNVTTNLQSKNITVATAGSAPDIEPTGVLTKSAIRQYELIANDQTNIYVSLVGDSFNNSINSYRESVGAIDDASLTSSQKRTTALRAIETSMTAMMDDMLVAYGSAQLVIGNYTRSVPAAVTVQVLRFGEARYIYGIFVVNSLILLLVAVEAIRNRSWARMPSFDFLDSDDLVTYTWRACQNSLTAGRTPISGESKVRLSSQAKTLQLLR